MTYSIVAFDPDTRECGVAVQSHWFSVGGLVTWGEPGVGAVATQAVVEPAYGPRGLQRMRSGRSAPEALAELVAADELGAARQVAMVDARGGVAAHTGSDCMPFAGQAVGHHHSCQANLMRTAAVWDAMSAAYLGASGSLAERLLDALDAGEAAGGDLRGRQSAAILVVGAQGESWQRLVDLRVEDHEDPLGELRRIVRLGGSYALMREADETFVAGDKARSADLYVQAWEGTPENHELKFWAALALVERGEPERGTALLRESIDDHPGWRQMVDRLTVDMSPSIEEVRRLLGDYGADGGAGPT
ncbi:MAG TPA: DUF1028 domain-containing protein [Solirubrobacterales bacterium]|nr:DUF1028 domain-containing protein [Solirubrobacterales bacterium]